MTRAASLCAVLLMGCSGDPTLTFEPGAAVLVVGQKASVVVTSGGDGSDLETSSFVLTDAAGATYDAQTAELELQTISKDELQFSVPPGIAAGAANLSVDTKKGPAFSGPVTINRLMAMRDLSGKVWLLALVGDGSGAQFAEAKAGVFGFGFGHVAVGYRGRLLASTANSSNQLFLSWVGASLNASPPFNFDPTVVVNDLLVTPGGVTLVATNKGIYDAARPDADPPAEPTATALTSDDARGLAVDGAGLRAVAIDDPGASGTVGLTVIDLSVSPPTVLNKLSTSWSGGAGGTLSVAMSADGKRILAVNGDTDQVALFIEGNVNAVEQSLTSGESGPVSVAAAQDGTTFYLANKTSKNLSKVQTADDQVTFGAPLNLAASGNGVPVQVVASASDEVAVLMERDLILLYDSGTKANTLTFTNLFTDKVNGEVGGSLGIQP